LALGAATSESSELRGGKSGCRILAYAESEAGSRSGHNGPCERNLERENWASQLHSTPSSLSLATSTKTGITMKKLSQLLTILGVLSLVGVGAAFAGPARSAKPIKDGRGARAAVLKHRAARGKSNAHIRVMKIGQSRSGKSLVVAVEQKTTGKVSKLNVNKTRGFASATRTRGPSQGQASKKVNNLFRREKGPNKGTFSGVAKQGLSKRGNMKFQSQTDRNERASVNPTTGKITHRDGKGGPKNFKNPKGVSRQLRNQAKQSGK